MTGPLDESGFIPHPLRARVMAELHARPFTPVPTPGRVLRFVFMAPGEAAVGAVAALASLCAARGLSVPPADARHFAVDLDFARLRFERHNEFLTYTWRFPAGAEPFTPPADVLGRAMRLVTQPGPLIAAIDLHIVPRDSAPDLDAIFAGSSLAVSDVGEGRARVATDFRADVDGFLRIIVEDRGLTPAETGALVQRLLEMETYRTLALLGLPEAQALAPILDQTGTELSALMGEVQSHHGVDANRTLLERLTSLAARVERLAADSAFRFGATRAYHDLIDARIATLGERPVAPHSTLGAFLSRRLTPAIRTCAAVEARQADLSQKLARFADLLRTRVDIDLESQNALQLSRMSERLRLQLRLQQTVEGLSVAAITYYVASVLHLIFEGLHASGVHLNPAIATAVVVPIVAIVVGLLVWRIRHSHPAD